MIVYFVCPGCKRYAREVLETCGAMVQGLCHHADGTIFQMIACRDRRETTMYLARA